MNININLNDFVKSLYQQTTEQIKKIDFETGITIYLNNGKLNHSEGYYTLAKNHLNFVYRYFINEKIYELNELNQLSINKFINYMKARNNKAATINKRISLLFRVINFLVEQELLSPIDAKYIKLKEEQPKIKMITDKELEKLIKHVNKLRNRNKLIILLLISTGIRRTELTRIKIENIDLNENRILLNETKSHKARFIFITDEIKEYIKQELKNNSLYLFDTNGIKITPNAISLIIKKIKKQLNIENLTPHRLRHTYATYLLKNGCDIESVRRLLGHSTLTVTQRYLDYTNELLQSNNNKYNPLNIIKKD